MTARTTISTTTTVCPRNEGILVSKTCTPHSSHKNSISFIPSARSKVLQGVSGCSRVRPWNMPPEHYNTSPFVPLTSHERSKVAPWNGRLGVYECEHRLNIRHLGVCFVFCYILSALIEFWARHLAISAWFPLNSTSGTFIPL